MAELRWSYEDLADGLAAGLATAAAELELEQAVHGLDVRRELDLHPLLHAGLRAAGYGVHPEQRFPRERGLRGGLSSWRSKSSRPRPRRPAQLPPQSGENSTPCLLCARPSMGSWP